MGYQQALLLGVCLQNIQRAQKFRRARSVVTQMPPKSSYVRISGGLGNQLFQYAFSRTLAIGSGSSVLLDLERYSLDAGENARKCENRRWVENVRHSRSYIRHTDRVLELFLDELVASGHLVDVVCACMT